MSPTEAPPPVRAFALLKRGPFARYMGGEAISMLGTWMQQMAQGWVLASLTTSAFALGLVNFASGLPMILLTMWGGAVADRYDKRLVIISTLVVQSALAVAIGWLVGSGHIAIWHIVVAGVLWGVAAAFEVPAAAAIVPELVEKHEMSAAIAIDRSVFHATRLAGPALGGWLIGALGTSAAFYANALSFSALVLALLTIHPRVQNHAADEEQRSSGMKEGLAHVRGDRLSLVMVLLLALSTLFISPFFMILMPLYSMHILHLGPAEHGILLGASGLGALTGSLALLSIPSARRVLAIRIAVTVVALAMVGLGMAQGLASALVSIVILTIGSSTMFGLTNTIVQERAPDAIRGRVSAVISLSFFGVLPFSGLIMSKVADLIGMRTALLWACITYGILALILLSRAERSGPVRGE